MDHLIKMLRDWQNYCHRRHDRQSEADAFKAAADEIEKLNRLLDLWKAAAHSGGMPDKIEAAEREAFKQAE